MPLPFERYFKNSSLHLIVWVVTSVAILMVVSLTVMFQFSRQAVKEEALAKASQTLDGMVLNIDNVLSKVEVAAIGMHWNIEHHLEKAELMEGYCRQMLEDNPYIVSCAIAMEPYYYQEHGREFITYCYRRDMSSERATQFAEILAQDYFGKTSYLYQNWYTVTLHQGKPCWIKPSESNSGNQQLVSYCMPIRDRYGLAVGVFGVDVSLDWFSKTILDTKPFPNSYCSMIGRKGTYIIHPDTVKLHNRTVYDLLADNHDKQLEKLLDAMAAGESGYQSVIMDGQENYVFYKPFHYKEWAAAIVCPKSDVLGTTQRLQYWVLFIALLGLVGLLTFGMLIMNHSLKPLGLLAQSAHRLASGYYEGTIPASDRKDEIGSLQNSFIAMQQSITKYMMDIKQTNEVLRERNEALRVATEQAQEDERMKSAFINNMTDKMRRPVFHIEDIVKEMRHNYEHMKPEVMEQMADQVQEDATTVTELLDQIIEVSQKKGGDT